MSQRPEMKYLAQTEILHLVSHMRLSMFVKIINKTVLNHLPFTCFCALAGEHIYLETKTSGSYLNLWCSSTPLTRLLLLRQRLVSLLLSPLCLLRVLKGCWRWAFLNDLHVIPPECVSSSWALSHNIQDMLVTCLRETWLYPVSIGRHWCEQWSYG